MAPRDAVQPSSRMTNTAIILDKVGSVAVVTLNRPHVLNAYDTTMRDALWEALQAVIDDDEVRCFLIRGAGRAFCAGADLTEFGTAPSQAIARDVRWRRDVWGLLRDLAKPSIAAMHGFAIGAGLELALLCDIRIAAKGTLLGLAESRWGMIPGAGGTQSVTRVGRLGTALDLVLTGRSVDAGEALDRGLVTMVVAADELATRSLGLAEQLAALPATALAMTRRAVHEGLHLSLAEGIALERRLGDVAALAR